mmetsp:Transcript_26301/g.70197  ORF Transcript_26301/g.70197 Transcript_26301/m.70197 type:complete len:250 (-) Transcript_26301:495-1244(-)
MLNWRSHRVTVSESCAAHTNPKGSYAVTHARHAPVLIREAASCEGTRGRGDETPPSSPFSRWELAQPSHLPAARVWAGTPCADRVPWPKHGMLRVATSSSRQQAQVRVQAQVLCSLSAHHDQELPSCGSPPRPARPSRPSQALRPPHPGSPPEHAPPRSLPCPRPRSLLHRTSGGLNSTTEPAVAAPHQTTCHCWRGQRRRTRFSVAAHSARPASAAAAPSRCWRALARSAPAAPACAPPRLRARPREQ